LNMKENWEVINKTTEFPEWIIIDSHVSIRGFRALCLRCQSRNVGKLKECKEWTKNHISECKGATCQECGHVYEGFSRDRCPKCSYCVND